MVPTHPLALQSEIGPILDEIKLISFIRFISMHNREAWSDPRKVVATNFGPIPDVVDKSLSGPELSQANWTMSAVNILPHYVFNTMGFETVQRQ